MSRNVMLGLAMSAMLFGIGTFGGAKETEACVVQSVCCPPVECCVCSVDECCCPEVCVETKRRCRVRCTTRGCKYRYRIVRNVRCCNFCR